MLLLKITIVPLLIGAVSIAGQRWGHKAAGILAGLPVVVGPILLLLWLEHGAPFARIATIAALSAMVPVAVFIAIYAYGSLRAGWLRTLTWAYIAWISSTFIMLLVPLDALLAANSAFVSLLCLSRLLPNVVYPTVKLQLPKVELAARMCAGMFVTLVVTTCADLAGERLAGTLALFPTITAVLAVFTHRGFGGEASVILLRGISRGLFSIVVFCVVLLAVPSDRPIVVFPAAVAVLLIFHGVMLWWRSRPAIS